MSSSKYMLWNNSRPVSTLLLSICLIILTTFTFVNEVDARRWASTELPNPQNDPGGQCGRGKKSAICDPDGYLSESEGDTIDGLINFIEEGSHGFKQMQCSNGMRGAQIAVGIVDHMPFGIGKKEDRAFRYARDLHDRWGVGDAECQTGAVIFLAIKDRAMGISTGAGIKKLLPDSQIPKVMDLMKSKLREEEYGQAVIAAVTAIGNVISGGSMPSSDEDFNVFGGIVAVIAAGGIATAITRGVRSNRRYRRCKKLLSKIDNDREKASKKKYVATSCPICLEDFEAKPSDKAPKPEKNSDKNDEENLSLTQNETETQTSPGNDFESESTEKVKMILEREAKSVSRAATGTTTDTGSNNSNEESVQRINTLPCGHMFHHSCIASWISSSRSNSVLCPVCRQPIMDSEEGDRIRQRTNNGAPSGWDVYDPEYDFRMRRMHYYYDDFVTWQMIDAWNRDRYSHHRHATHRDFIAVDPQVVAEAARASGRGGSSFSFGGGSSAGGGGGGGSW